ncbi:SGNH/GDSL hydrolase family protein [Streptomyces halobius]|uniref:SGNH/GDSL hydrolase family protein n=1 Tax=Streptomyces halobius TaxID=2879846 RepID=A0ABY4MIZ5_9ACTN|nr:SGNH/GDSL hydrolase family protein [Streptomyces halobius]UQA96301.1 SGNH/GDSL hydrolase family protein [Streptomyces halobius]
MRLSRFAAITSAFSLASALALTGASAAASAQLTAATGYVALGDSYSSGVGAGSYDGGSGSCKRSTRAYPALWSAAHAPSSFSFTACSGARTGDVLNGQLGPLNDSTGLVSITVGGNDAGFADTMTTCALQGESACLARVAQAVDYIHTTLPGKLDTVYRTIAGKAPNADVVVLGYPRFYKLNGSCAAGLSEKSRAAINGAADEINGVTEKRAAEHGFLFADVNRTFAGHELCSGSPWLHSVTWPVEESYHPTAAGQSGGYFPVLDSAA